MMKAIIFTQGIGICPACKGKLTRVLDQEKRAWARCADCNAQFPLEYGYSEHKRPVVDELSDKAAE